MKVIMTGGGTGGHIYPAIAIANKIKKENKDAEILFVGTQKGLESSLVPENGYEIKTITVRGFNRKKLLTNFKTITDLLKGIKEAKKIIEDFNPDVVIGTGGYVCGPVVYAASKKGKKTFIQEQNAFPGLTNKLLEKHVKNVFISFEKSKEYFKKKNKLILTGNPLREEFINFDEKKSKDIIGLKENQFGILYFGGSRGAETLNEVMIDVAKKISEEADTKLFFVTGEKHYDKVSEILKEKVGNTNSVEVYKYIHNISDYMIGSNLIISRAGAVTISEIAAIGKPSIIIPSPYVTNNHQYFNGKVLEDNKGAIMIEEKNLSSEKITESIKTLKNNKSKYISMANNCKVLGNTEALDIIYKTITEA